MHHGPLAHLADGLSFHTESGAGRCWQRTEKRRSFVPVLSRVADQCSVTWGLWVGAALQLSVLLTWWFWCLCQHTGCMCSMHTRTSTTV